MEPFIENCFETTIIPTLTEYIRIPNLSPSYDSMKTSDRECEKVIQLFSSWIESQNVSGLKYHISRIENKTPLIFIEIASSADSSNKTVLMYGHLDKQPPFEGWTDGLGPYIPVIRDGRLYGRGGADDGYAIFSAITAIKALQIQGINHDRCVILIESSEESGSPDLPFHLDVLKDKIGDVSLVVCLDSGAGDYDGLWLTTSLRGILVATLKVSTLTEGVHSGNSGGLASDSFRIVRQLLSRLEDENTGAICDILQTIVPDERLLEINEYCSILRDSILDAVPLVNHGQPLRDDKNLVELVLNNTWRPCLTITGIDGLPPCPSGGNVLRPSTTVKLSLRLPPTTNWESAANIVKDILTTDVPKDCVVELDICHGASGYSAPILSTWLKESLNKCSHRRFGRSFANMGCGGTIPFMGMLGRMFPKADFVITGVLGPHSNAHGPNEFLDIQYCKKLTCCIAEILEDFSKIL
jgi:acetylornithine deacetylase/succinyl-diaminopimelate desuccinylase-like protein